ncbi:MAG: segregation/condensation protein A [Candidatus Pacebacteria bacterium]|nr:segregation/condensation protein A [Candidatus Paceibacterota bacterium]
MTFQIKTETFEGPLDLLLSLVEKHKFFINDISLSKVTDDYIAHVNALEHYSIPDRANFIVVASTLLLIKSRSLLPSLSLTEEEQGSIEDLEKRLREYQQIKALSKHVRERFGNTPIFPGKGMPVESVFSPSKEVSGATGISNIFTAIRNVLQSLPKKELIPKAVLKKVISLEEMMDNLAKRITSSLKMSFRDFAKIGKEEKVNVIVSFLAMLELVKQGLISVTQSKMFDEIEMESNDLGIPRYH